MPDNAKNKADIVQLRAARPCPICGKPSVREFFPFDTKRCADIDLNRWLSGSYTIPGEDVGARVETDSPDGRESD
jgi:endogenous inhibitor of DNA gyrase (YacG/DUF329 family)